MIDQALPPVLEEVFNAQTTPDAVFAALLPALCEVLQCDRCFLYLRDPQTRTGQVPHCWCRRSDYPDVTTLEWQQEPTTLSQEDPLFAAALRIEPSIYVEDVETTDPSVVNVAFEQEHFGHRALVHAHLRQDGQLWGILQPCIFGQPRVWSEFDRSVVDKVTEKITPLVIAYVQAAKVGQ